MEHDNPEVLSGGNSNRVVRYGDTVVRDTGAWSPFVHALLRYLTAAGFTQSPIVLEVSDKQERLSFIDGEVGHYPLKPYMQSDDMLVEVAQFLRRFHDLTQHFVVPPNSIFQHAFGQVHEVICHNDFAPYNCIFKDGHLVGLIDFDVVSPGTRLWDIAYAVYRYAPLTNPGHTLDCGWQPTPDRAARLKLFCDAYGLENRVELIPTVLKRLEFLVERMHATASNLDHIPFYLEDMAYIRDNLDQWII